ncbi:MAG: hypothetical protein Q9178_007657 [Gyalolechia marmorata]
MDILYRRVLRLFNNPLERDVPFAAGHPGAQWKWEEPAGAVVKPHASLMVLVPEIRPGTHPRKITIGDVADALKGVNWIRLRYPMLDVHCRIVDDLAERWEDDDFGFVSLSFEGKDEDAYEIRVGFGIDTSHLWKAMAATWELQRKN